MSSELTSTIFQGIWMGGWVLAVVLGMIVAVSDKDPN
jgi:hypothetical protein